MSYLNIENVEEYNLDNSIIIQKQIDLLDHYNFEGLAIYYYWFSHNTVTNKNMIMENVINKFFNKSLDLKKRRFFSFGQMKIGVITMHLEIILTLSKMYTMSIFREKCG